MLQATALSRISVVDPAPQPDAVKSSTMLIPQLPPDVVQPHVEPQERVSVTPVYHGPPAPSVW